MKNKEKRYVEPSVWNDCENGYAGYEFHKYAEKLIDNIVNLNNSLKEKH